MEKIMACGRSRLPDRGGERCGIRIRTERRAARAARLHRFLRGTGRGTFQGLNHLNLLTNYAGIERPAAPAESASYEFRKTFHNSDGRSPQRDQTGLSGTVGEGTFAMECRWAG